MSKRLRDRPKHVRQARAVFHAPDGRLGQQIRQLFAGAIGEKPGRYFMPGGGADSPKGVDVRLHRQHAVVDTDHVFVTALLHEVAPAHMDRDGRRGGLGQRSEVLRARDLQQLAANQRIICQIRGELVLHTPKLDHRSGRRAVADSLLLG